jgi:ATP-dependent RNA circularization protein (DNA/RNA ligase family)
MKYPKIDTIWKRDENNKYVIMEGEYSKQEFKNIREWIITEKIHGTNMRVEYDTDPVTRLLFKGRTEHALVPTFLLDYMQRTFTVELINGVFGEAKEVVLYGEGYGPKIQKGGEKYRSEVAFILFDVFVDGWWLSPVNVVDVATKMGVRSVPQLGIMTVDEAVSYVKSRPHSLEAMGRMVMEGIVARSNPLVLFRNGNPVMWKLKVEDYEKLERFGGE